VVSRAAVLLDVSGDLLFLRTEVVAQHWTTFDLFAIPETRGPVTAPFR
jgi:hypothetical protein